MKDTFQQVLDEIKKNKAIKLQDESNGFLESYSFFLPELKVTVQTDNETHLETIIEHDGEYYSNGGDFMSKPSDWQRWAQETTTLVNAFKTIKLVELEKLYSFRQKYIGGSVKVTTYDEQQIMFNNIDNNFHIFKRSKKKKIYEA